MKINKVLIALYIVLALMVGAVVAQRIEQSNSRAALAGTVKYICDYSRSVHSGEAEEACGIAQDVNGLDYNCPSFNSSVLSCTVTEKK